MTFTRSFSINSLSGPANLLVAPSTPLLGGESQEAPSALELDLENLFGNCGFTSTEDEEEGGSIVADDKPLPPALGKARGGKELAQLACLQKSRKGNVESDEKLSDAMVDDEGDRPHWRKARASRVKVSSFNHIACMSV